MNWVRRLMYGRCGADQLGYALLAGYLLCCLLARLTRSSLFSLIGLCLVVFAFYRMFSRQLERRRRENAKFMDLVRPVVHRYNVSKCRRNDRDHRYFRCPNCGQQLRAPKGKGKIQVTCRNCGATFEEST